jgi:hypothetical protein
VNLPEPEDFARFEQWAKDHLGQGYSLECEEGTYVNRVTRWAYIASRAFYAEGFRAGMERAAVIAEDEGLNDPNTESDGDIAYDLAIEHVVAAIRTEAASIENPEKHPPSANNGG